MAPSCHAESYLNQYTQKPPKRCRIGIAPVPLRYRFDTQNRFYACLMASMKQTTLRLSATQFAQLEKLSDKLGLTQAGVIRFALSRLVEEEKILISRKK